MLAIKCCGTKKGANDADYLLPIAVLVPVLIAWTSSDSLPQRCITTGVIPLYLWPDFAPYKSLTQPRLTGICLAFPVPGAGEGMAHGTEPGCKGGSKVKAP